MRIKGSWFRTDFRGEINNSRFEINVCDANVQFKFFHADGRPDLINFLEAKMELYLKKEGILYIYIYYNGLKILITVSKFISIKYAI